MELRNTNQISSLDRVFAAFLAAFSMFIVGYTAIRVYLNQPSANNNAVKENVIPHEASLWSTLGE